MIQLVFEFTNKSFPQMISSSFFVDYFIDKATWSLVSLHDKYAIINTEIPWWQ